MLSGREVNTLRYTLQTLSERLGDPDHPGAGFVLEVRIIFLLVTSGNIRFFKEPLSAIKLAGIVLILCSIATVTNS